MLQAGTHFSSTNLLTEQKKKKRSRNWSLLKFIVKIKFSPSLETTIRFQIAVHFRASTPSFNPWYRANYYSRASPLTSTSAYSSIASPLRSNSFLPLSFPNSAVPVTTRFTFTESFFITFKLPDCSARS